MKSRTTVKDYIKILRPEQWYKNLLIFLAIFYSFNLFDSDKLLATSIGFITLSLLSSANYVLNDIADKKKDIDNPLKKSRPIASGKISIKKSLLIFIILSLTGLLTAYWLDKGFFFLMILFLSLTSLYSFFMKNEMFIDVLLIAINFVIRTVSGAFIIKVFISPWLVLSPFFLSLFLSVGKRQAEFLILGKYASKSRETLAHYTEKLTNSLMIVTTTILVITYAFYTVSIDIKLLITLPVVLYAIFRYLYFIYSKPIIAANPELAFKDKRFVISVIAWFLVTLLLLYIK